MRSLKKNNVNFNFFEEITWTRSIAHDKRREKRAEEFRPYDEIIMKQIPGNDATEAEQRRAEIRLKYETLQADIDNAPSINELKFVIDNM